MRVGIIGLGVGEQHIEGYRGCEIAMLCDFDHEKLEQVGAHHPDASLTSNASDVFADSSIDIVSIASYDHHHAQQVLRALETGKHVFCEKPLCLNRSELAEIQEALRPDLKLSCNLPLRYSPRFQQARELDLGRIYYIDAAYDYGRREKLKGWRGYDDYSVVCGGLVHMIDLVLWITGERMVDVSARGAKVLGHPFNDLVVATLKMEGGALVRLTANFACVGPHFHELQLFGTEGTFVNTPGAPVIPKYAAIPGFVGAVRDGYQPPIPPDDIFDAMEVCFAIEEAVDSIR